MKRKISFNNQNVSVEVSHLYTYGTDNPQDLTNRVPSSEDVSIEVDINEIESLVGGLFDPIKFNMFKYAALGIKPNGSKITLQDLRKYTNIDSNGNGYLTQEQMENALYGRILRVSKKENERALANNLYWQDSNREYNADIAYVLGSYTTELSENNIYYFKNGKLSEIR